MDEKVIQLRELLAASTPGPWVIPSTDANRLRDISTLTGENTDGEPMHWNVATVNQQRDESEANAALIVAMHEALPELLAERDSLRADALRYRWLRDCAGQTLPLDPNVPAWIAGRGNEYIVDDWLAGERADQIIDRELSALSPGATSRGAG